MVTNYQTLVKHLGTIHDLQRAASVLSLDQEAYMPKGGTAARARQLSTLARLSHQMFTSDETGKLLESAEQEQAGADYHSDEAGLLRITRWRYDEQVKIPTEFAAKMAHLRSIAHEDWVKARAEKNFALFQPKLEEMMDMARQLTEYLGYDEVPYDALLSRYDRGMTTREVQTIFEAHKPALVELISQISHAPQVDDSFLYRHYDVQKQREIALKFVTAMGFDFARGNTAEVTHPFCITFSMNDVRITNRYDANFINPALFGMMHEAGHGMYEQGVAQRFDGTLLGSGTSLSVHESQSRMWENLVGRSRGFWEWAYPQLQATFPDSLGDVSVDAFYRAINKVQRSFIRVEADEATYNLHIMLRLELEIGLMNGSIRVADLPHEWNSRFHDYFGITPPNDAEGVLQDVHWSSGLIGYFSTYALGNLLSVQYYNQAVQEHPQLPHEIHNGKFDTLLTWLNNNIHQHGTKYTTEEVTERVTGTTIQSDPYIAYLRQKYSEIYGL